MKPHKDLTNRTFGKLNVKEYLRREPAICKILLNQTATTTHI